MDSRDIIKGIEAFFSTASAKELAEVDAAFSVEFDGDVSLEEYLGGFSSEYFYVDSSASNTYRFSARHLAPGGEYGRLDSFENTESDYEGSYLVMSSKVKSAAKGQVAKMVKTAA